MLSSRSGRYLSVALIFTAVVAISGCKKKKSTPNGRPGVEFPVRAAGGGEGDASFLVKVGTVIPGDGQILRLNLDRLPPPGAVNPLACWDVPPPEQALGNAVCLGDAEKGFEITAAHVEFVCSSNPGFGTLAPRITPPFTGCATYEVYSYQFEPHLALSLEPANP